MKINKEINIYRLLECPELAQETCMLFPDRPGLFITFEELLDLEQEVYNIWVNYQDNNEQEAEAIKYVLLVLVRILRHMRDYGYDILRFIKPSDDIIDEELLEYLELEQ